MTPAQADRIIKLGKPVTVTNRHFNETFTRVFVSRDRWNITSEQGEKFDRGELILTK
jgi:hypothetical protein